jgi:hypothetical protein
MRRGHLASGWPLPMTPNEFSIYKYSYIYTKSCPRSCMPARFFLLEVSRSRQSGQSIKSFWILSVVIQKTIGSDCQFGTAEIANSYYGLQSSAQIGCSTKLAVCYMGWSPKNLKHRNATRSTAWVTRSTRDYRDRQEESVQQNEQSS